MEGMEILADTGSLKLRMAIIYWPPPSTENGLTVAGFLDHFSNFMEGYISNNEKLLMMGDFNFHVGDVADTTARRFSLHCRCFKPSPTYYRANTYKR